MPRYKMDLKAYLCEFFLLCILLIGKNIAEAALDVTESEINATGIDNGISVKISFTGPTQVTCLVVSEIEDEVDALKILLTDSEAVETRSDTSGFRDIYIPIFGAMEFVVKKREQFYAGWSVSGIDISNNSTGSVIPYNEPLTEDVIFQFTFSGGTNVNITLSIPYGWTHSVTDVDNGTYSITIPKEEFEPPGLYTIDVNFENPINSFLRSAVIGVQSPIVDVDISIPQYNIASSPLYIMVGQPFYVSITLTSGNDLLLSLLVENETAAVDLKGHFCEGTHLQSSIQYTFASTGSYNLTVQISNYVSNFNQTIEVEVIQPVNSFTFQVTPPVALSTDSISFIASVSDTAKLPMGTVVCEVDFDDGSAAGSMTFDMSPTTFNDLQKNTDTVTKTYLERWYATTVNCTNQLPFEVNDEETYQYGKEMVKVVNDIKSKIKLNHGIGNLNHHPFTDSITFTVLETSDSNLPNANVTCEFSFNDGTEVSAQNVTGDTTNTSSGIRLTKSLAGGKDHTIIVNCSNLKTSEVLPSLQVTVYFNCWQTSEYFDSIRKSKNNGNHYMSFTNKPLTLSPSVKLSDACDRPVYHYWTLYKYSGDNAVFVQNMTSESATTITLERFTVKNRGFYKIELCVYFSNYNPLPVLCDYAVLEFVLAPLEVSLKTNGSANSILSMRLDNSYLDTSESYDPSDADDINSLTRIWECRVIANIDRTDVLSFVAGTDVTNWPDDWNDDCTDYLDTVEDSFIIDKTKFVVLKYYVVLLKLKHVGEITRESATAQALYFLEDDPLNMTLKCLSCHENYTQVAGSSYVIALKDLRINCVILTPGVYNNSMTYTWTLKRKIDDLYSEVNIADLQEFTTGFNLSKEILKDLQNENTEAQYTVTCKVEAKGFAITSSDFTFTINQMPYAGNCVFSPIPTEPVTATLTTITVKCSDWKDEDNRPKRNELEDGASNIKYRAVQLFLTPTNEVNETKSPNAYELTDKTKLEFTLMKPTGGVSKSRIQIWISDQFFHPYNVVNLGDIEIKPAVPDNAEGVEGASMIQAVYDEKKNELENALALNNLPGILNSIDSLADAMPLNPKIYEPIPVDNINDQSITADDLYKSYQKTEPDPTIIKAQEIMSSLTSALLSSSNNQSADVKKSPESQIAVAKTMTTIARGGSTYLTKETKETLNDVANNFFENTKDIKGNDPAGQEFMRQSIEAAAKVAGAMSPPELKGSQVNPVLESERKKFENQNFLEDEWETPGDLSDDERIYYLLQANKIQTSKVDESRSVSNAYSKNKDKFGNDLTLKIPLNDGATEVIETESATFVMTTDTAEKLTNRSLNTSSSSISIKGLGEMNLLQNVKVAVIEQGAVSHIDSKGLAGKVSSGESTLVIETTGTIPGTVKVVQKVPMIELDTLDVRVDSDDASGFFTYLKLIVDSDFENLNFVIEPDPDSSIRISKLFGYILYCDVKDFETKFVSKLEYTAFKEMTKTDTNQWTAEFPPAERGRKSGIYKVGIELIEDNSEDSSRSKRSAFLTKNETVKFGTATMACMTWDDIRDEWRADECTGKWKPSTGELECDCIPKKKLTFANSFYVPPNKIDFGSVLLKFSPLNQAAVMSVLILIFIIYILIIIWTRRQDRKDLLKWGITPLSDNFMEDNYFYVIKVFTGMRPGAGTKSRICMVICGEEMDTGVRELYDGVRDEFSTGSVMNFLMSTTVYLGDLDYIRIWHDNSGGGNLASWYLSRIDVHDVQRNESFTFLGERWLAVEKEDGLLECILPVCKSENMNVFKNRFFMNAKDNLADSHIWISVAYRPQVSNFTRTQRASCALLFVMLTMIANAVFFKSSNEENYETPAEVQVGPFRFSLQQIYVSFICALIVTPGTLLVIYLFKLARRDVDPNETLFKPNDKASRYRIPFMKDWLENEQKRSMELEQHMVQKGLPNMQGFKLPHWCRNLAWFIVVVTSFICAFFIMLYSMEWGKQKSEEWITTFLLSFFESVFCLDPVKVGIMAVVLAILFRSTKDSEAPVNRSTIMKRYSSSLRGKSKGLRLPAPPLDHKKLEKAREEKQRDMLMKRALRDIIVNIIIIWILFSISFSNRDTMSYYMHKRVVDTFLEPPNMPAFTSIKTTTDFFTWMQKTAIINGFPEYEKDANNTPLHWRVRQFTEGGTHFRVGPPRLRQLRTTKKSCSNSPFPTVNCYKKYYETTEETEGYCIGWKDGPCHPDEKIYNFTSEAWKFTSAFDIWGMPISGFYTSYGGGGYISKLSVNRQVSESIVDELFRNSWVDRQTRAVLFEFTLYSLNANIFTYNMFMVEFPETGGAMPFYMILPMRVFLHQGPLGLYTLACEVLFVLYLIFLTVMIIIQIYQQKKDFFQQGWQVFDLIFIILGYIAIIMNIVQIIFTNMSLDVFREDKKAFVNFYHLALWNTILVLLIGLLVFMATVRMLNILGYNKRIGAVAKVFTKAASDLLWFGLFFSYVFVCYAAFGFLLFGWKLTSYKNVFKTMGTLFISMIGKSRFTEIEETDPVFSKVYFMCFIFFVVYMILTMFLAVLAKAIDQVHEDTKKDKNEEMVDYCIKKMKGLLSYGGGAKKSAVKPAPWSRGDQSKHRGYQKGKFTKTSNREILQEIRETMNEALTGNRRDFCTPDSEQHKRQVKFRR